MSPSDDKIWLRDLDADLKHLDNRSDSEELTTSSEIQEDDEANRLTTSLRPETFAEYIGQNSIKETLKLAVNATKKRGEALDHTLFHGPPGLGKTSMAKVVANELNVGFKSTSGPVIERPGDLAALLTSLDTHDLFFIDEIHRLPRVVEEVLYPAMEDFQIDILIGQGAAAKAVKIDLKPFTLVGATTRTGLLTSPLRDRFGIVLRLEYYNSSELTSIIERAAEILNIQIEKQAALEIGGRARGTPRIANRLLKRIRDVASSQSSTTITHQIAKRGLEQLEIDECGLDRMDRALLRMIIEKFSGGPVGVETIAAALREDRDTIEDVYEPFLLQEGYIARTRRGREVTQIGYQHLRLPYQARESNQPDNQRQIKLKLE
jgi:Holliday junction DNA helicase RuvB